MKRKAYNKRVLLKYLLILLLKQQRSLKNIRREARKIKLNTVKSAIDNCLTRYQQVLASKERWVEQIINY